ncbi:hypothetical protein QUA00_30470 [Microcoleus sp. T2B6]|uniref:hypothetical protein n=1 Tax=Microcoleus sp. T2B6 TaxID=3055424 RepID=UPI002FD5F616
MPVPQRVNLIVGWASCPSLKSLWKMVQDISKTKFHPTENLRKLDRPINFLYKSQKICLDSLHSHSQAVSDRSAY